MDKHYPGQESKDGRTAAAEGSAVAERRAAFGQQLRALREANGVSLESLSDTTRISVAFLTALEAGALEKLPGRVFARGFVHNIAKNFGVDPQDLLSEFVAVWDLPTTKSVLKVEIKNQPVKLRSERTASLIHTTKSLIRRGVTVKIAVPVVALISGVYLVTSKPVRKMLWQNLRHEASIVAEVRAKPLILSPQMEGGSPTVVAGKPAIDAKAEALQAARTPPTAVALGDVAAAGSNTPSTARDVGDAPETVAPPVAKAAIAPPPDADDAGTLKTGAATSKHDDEAKAAAAIPEIVAVKAEPAPAGSQTLEVTVLEPVRIRLDVDHGKSVTKQLSPDTYRFNFNQVAEMLIYNAGAVKISFNGKPIGSLGSKGRVRRVSFQAAGSPRQSL